MANFSPGVQSLFLLKKIKFSYKFHEQEESNDAGHKSDS